MAEYSIVQHIVVTSHYTRQLYCFTYKDCHCDLWYFWLRWTSWPGDNDIKCSGQYQGLLRVEWLLTTYEQCSWSDYLCTCSRNIKQSRIITAASLAQFRRVLIIDIFFSANLTINGEWSCSWTASYICPGAAYLAFVPNLFSEQWSLHSRSKLESKFQIVILSHNAVVHLE